MKQISGEECALFTYFGSYQFLSAVSDTIYGKLIPENQYNIADAPCFEVYQTNPETTKTEESITKIYVPIE